MSSENGRRGRLTPEQLVEITALGTRLPQLPEHVRKALESNFETIDIRDYGETPDGRKMTSIDPNAVIRRLHDCFQGAWSFNILNYNIEYRAGQIIAQVRLSYEVWVDSPSPNGYPQLMRIEREAIGNAPIKIVQGQMNPYDQGLPVYFNIGWDVKAAVTDGLKKAASLFGIGFFLWERDGTTSTPAVQQQNQAPMQQQQNAGPQPQFAQSFQIDKIRAFFESRKYSTQQWTSWFGITDIESVPMELANAILSGSHPVMVDFSNKTGHYINTGLAASNAR